MVAQDAGEPLAIEKLVWMLVAQPSEFAGRGSVRLAGGGLVAGGTESVGDIIQAKGEVVAVVGIVGELRDQLFPHGLGSAECVQTLGEFSLEAQERACGEQGSGTAAAV